MKLITPVFLIVACSAPELAPQTDLAGAQPIASGPLIEDQSIDLPASAWTAAVPLTVVAPGGSNLAVLDRLGVRVEVSQVRQGRILVRCTGCPDDAAGAEGWMPRGVLWSGPDPSAEAKEPLSLALQLRTTWLTEPPTGFQADQACAIVDRGWRLEPNRATAEAFGGSIVLERTGSTWRFVSANPPTEAIRGDCG